MYLNSNKIYSYLNGSRLTIQVLKNLGYTIPITSMKVINKNITTEIGWEVPIIVDIESIDADYILPSYTVDDETIVKVQAGVIRPLKSGTTSVTVTSPDGRFTEIVNVNVTTPSVRETITEAETYTVIPEDYNISIDGTNATETTVGINTMLQEASANGYKKVVFPKGTYLIDYTTPIQMVSNMTLDLGGATFQQQASTGNNIILLNVGAGVTNCRITNGNIVGDRDNRETTDNQETIHGINLNACSHVEIDNLNINKFLGYGVALGGNVRKAMCFIFKNNLIETSTNEWETVDYIDISSVRTQFEICNPFGYGGWGAIQKDTATIDIVFYNANKEELSTITKIKPFRICDKPNNAKYVHLKIHNTTLGDGNADFGNSVAYICDYDYSDYIHIHDCDFSYCKSLGIAYSGTGYHNRIVNCTFSNNGGANATRDIDLEDGWESMRNLLIKGCTFNSRLSIVLCAGSDIVLVKNTINGELDISDRTVNTRLVENNINGKVDTNIEWYGGGLFMEGNVCTNNLVVFKNARSKEKANKIYSNYDTYNNSRIVNNSTYQEMDLRNCTLIGNCTFSGKVVTV